MNPSLNGPKEGNTAHAIERWLVGREWKGGRNYGGELELMSPDSEWLVTVGIDGWALGKFTDVFTARTIKVLSSPSR